MCTVNHDRNTVNTATLGEHRRHPHRMVTCVGEAEDDADQADQARDDHDDVAAVPAVVLAGRDPLGRLRRRARG